MFSSKLASTPSVSSSISFTKNLLFFLNITRALYSHKLRSRTPFGRIYFFPFVCFKAPQNFKTFEKTKKVKTPLCTRPSSFLRQINTPSRNEDKRCWFRKHPYTLSIHFDYKTLFMSTFKAVWKNSLKRRGI